MLILAWIIVITVSLLLLLFMIIVADKEDLEMVGVLTGLLIIVSVTILAAFYILNH